VDLERLLNCRCSRRELLVIGAGLLVACKGSSGGTATTVVPTATTLAAETPGPVPTTANATSPTVAPEPTPTAESPEIEVIGDEDFKEWTRQALDRLQAQAPDAYGEVLASIDVIESVDAGSGMYVEEKRYAVGDQTAHAPGYDEPRQLIWFAGTVVHDAHHSNQFARSVPHTGKDAEVECLTVQKAALELLTAEPFFANYVQGLIDGADDPANQYWNQPNRHW